MVVYIDESISPHIARALDVLEKREPNRADVNSIQDAFGKGIKDVDLIPEMGKQNAIWITKDKHILKRAQELQLLLSHNLGVFILRPGKKARHWDMVIMLFKAWPEIKRLAAGNRPFAYKIDSNSKITLVNRVK